MVLSVSLMGQIDYFNCYCIDILMWRGSNDNFCCVPYLKMIAVRSLKAFLHLSGS